jgi:hypothetical protein
VSDGVECTPSNACVARTISIFSSPYLIVRAFAAHSSACSQSTIVHACTHSPLILNRPLLQIKRQHSSPGSRSVRFNSRFFDLRHPSRSHR